MGIISNTAAISTTTDTTPLTVMDFVPLVLAIVGLVVIARMILTISQKKGG